MNGKRFPIKATAALALLVANGVPVMAWNPLKEVERVVPTPNVPIPNIPKPNIPKPNVPKPNFPNVPKPNFPTNVPKPNFPKPNVPTNFPKPNFPKPNVPTNFPKPNIPKPNIPNPIEEAKKQAAQLDKLRQQAERVVRDFNRMKDEAAKAKREYDRLAKLAESDKLDPQKEAYRALTAAGVLRSNRADVVKGIDRGLSVVVWAKEFDHFEQQKFVAALAASVATANPGPALVYIKQFAVQTKAVVLKNLRSAPARAQRKVQAEFERLLVGGLNAAVKGRQPPGFGIDGVDLTVALATYNHWVDVRVNNPRLVPTEKVLGVQLYRIATDPKSIRVPLPNTFQPYLKLTVRTGR